jgi:plasmid stability protein
MATVTLKKIPAELHRQLKKRAEQNHRSLNKEIIATLTSAASGTHRLDVEAMTREARAARAKFTRQISAAEIDAWKRAGRP